MGRAPCCDKDSVKRGPWSLEEDATLKSHIENHGTGGNWMALPRKAGLRRCGKSCRLRWLNYLRPDIKHGGFTEEEDNIIFTLYSQMGSRWSVIAAQLPGRTDNEVKNYWNTKLKKKKQLLTGNSSATAKSDKMIYSHDHSFVSKAEPHSFVISASSQPQKVTDISFGLSSASFHGSQSNSDPVQLYCPGLMDVSEFGATSKNSTGTLIVSLSQDKERSSNISHSSSFGLDKFVSLAGNGYVDDSGLLMGWGFGSSRPYGLDNSLTFPEKLDGEFGPTCYPNMGDFTFTDIKSRGVVLDPNVINQY
ncbi:hypothetical protein I3843_15G038000 [Carya illinoinensis]|uniref:Uncharacterized protein n=1 Tax=Carya illinoinensis TaxID=32201 RepID=A0A922D7G1_CARIL|nr:hypothetical protein I3760_15G041600 [Carya illinoinensis]KAG6674443.1 hypothetical protein I3842_15G041900 [Carya illinoinensis]KAG7943425.1 hypothetical protein I3843_15G038000 [Carya illinoinensis]